MVPVETVFSRFLLLVVPDLILVKVLLDLRTRLSVVMLVLNMGVDLLASKVAFKETSGIGLILVGVVGVCVDDQIVPAYGMERKDSKLYLWSEWRCRIGPKPRRSCFCLL